ncbi:MAG: N-acetyltransferase, partial [Termitinemataceae bacterium]
QHGRHDCVLILEGSRGGFKRPLGYILGTSDTAAYTEWFNQTWRPAVLAQFESIDEPQGSAQVTNRTIMDTSMEDTPMVPEEGTQADAGVWRLFSQPLQCPPWVQEYPGHIHIDLLPEAQGGGWGRKLMDAMAARFMEKGCHGFHLGVSAANEAAIAFYRRYGMQEVSAESWGIVFGKRLL